MPDAGKSPIIRAYTARIDDVNARDRTLVATINTGSIDRYKTCIMPRGIDVSNYLKNRVVLWEHGRDPMRGSMPIGRNEWVRPIIGPDGPEMRAKTCFFERGRKGDEFTERLFECYKDGDMRAWSVNIIPTEDCSPPTKDEIRQNPSLVDCWMMYRNSELAEYSAVAVGGQAEALTKDEGRSVLKCVSRGLVLPPDLVLQARRAAVEITEEVARRRLGRDGAKYLVYSRDGQELGRHDADAAARSQLAGLLADEIDDDQVEPDPPPEPELPPLGGRSYEAYRADMIGQVRGLFDDRAIKAELEMNRDWHRGRV
jgi:hypothetical protein